MPTDSEIYRLYVDRARKRIKEIHDELDRDEMAARKAAIAAEQARQMSKAIFDRGSVPEVGRVRVKLNTEYRMALIHERRMIEQDLEGLERKLLSAECRERAQAAQESGTNAGT